MAFKGCTKDCSLHRLVVSWETTDLLVSNPAPNKVKSKIKPLAAQKKKKKDVEYDSDTSSAYRVVHSWAAQKIRQGKSYASDKTVSQPP